MRGITLVKSFLAEHGTDMRRLFNTSTDSRRVKLRVKLIRLLDADGLNRSEISRVLDIDIGTVRYWLVEDARRRKMRARRTMYERNKIYQQWDECAKALAEARA